MSWPLRTIVIVGGGFSGTAVAVNLLRRELRGPTRIVLIERDEEVGRGVAYACRAFPYLLNVPAGRMSATSGSPKEFLHFLQRRLPRVTAEDFLPRALYGEYLQELLLAAKLTAPRNVQFEATRGEVNAVRRLARHLPLQVELADGRKFVADDVVLAVGNPAPRTLRAFADVEQHPGYVANPWSTDLSFNGNQTVLLIGTGLTMADVVNLASVHPDLTPRLHALSRHGLVPPRQTAFRPDAFKGDGHAVLLAASASLQRLTEVVRLLADSAEQEGGDWREAITFVRNLAPTLWQRLPERDRGRFLRHLRAHWDQHRHRLPPEVLQRVDGLRAQGKLQIHAGRIVRSESRGNRIEVSFRPRGADAETSLLVDRVINCTGPDYSVSTSTDPLWRSLRTAGLCVPDPQALGIRTGPSSAVIDNEGWPGPHLFYVGPMLRADHWEATAVAELRAHAEQLAKHLSQLDVQPVSDSGARLQQVAT
jgi:uncharacterized NAD(P)/FAD-binding protein YdhS